MSKTKQAERAPGPGVVNEWTSWSARSNGSGRNGHKADQSLADLPVKEQIKVLHLLDSESQERQVAMMLTKTRAGLDTALDLQDITKYRAKVAPLQKISKQLTLPRELKKDIEELARRADRRLGTAIREGQARGEIMTRGSQRPGILKVTDVATPGELHGAKGHTGIYAETDGVTDAQFEEILAEARAEGNLARVNIARKCCAIAQSVPKPEPKPPRRHRKQHKENCVSLDELVAIATRMPKQYQLMILLTGWCGLRFTELIELRRRDIDVDAGLIQVRRAMVRPGGSDGMVVTLQPEDQPVQSRPPARDISIIPPLFPALKNHLSNHVEPDIDALLFPGPANRIGHLSSGSLQHHYVKAREALERPDLRFENLRYTTLPTEADADALAQPMAALGMCDPPVMRKVRKTAGARKVMESLIISVNSFVSILGNTDPNEIELDKHRDDIADVLEGMGKIGKFLNRVKEQDNE